MLTKQLDVSAILTTYNRRNLLKRALLSVFKQTHSPRQVIVVDDGSEDETGKMVQQEFPDVEYIYQDNTGISAARNYGIQASRYPWIAFLDSDDEWHPEKLAEQVRALSQAPEYCLCHTDELWIRHGRRVNPKNKHFKSGGFIFEKCLPLCVISPSAVMIHRELFDKYGLFDEKMPACEDYDMWLRMCAHQPILYIDKKLVIKYGGHADQLSRKHWGMDRFRIYSLEKILNSGSLNLEQQDATLNELKKRLEIFISGAQKRGKNNEVKKFVDTYNKVIQQLNRTDLNDSD
jgi:glycosyltransferase involved in cell wall biosynthesis